MNYAFWPLSAALLSLASAHVAAKSPESLLRRGDTAFNAADYRAALTLYQDAQAQVPAASALAGEALNNIAAVYMAQGNAGEFQRAFNAAKQLKQALPKTLPAAGDNLLYNGDFESGLVFPWGTGHYERGDGRFAYGLWWNSMNAQAFMKIDRAERYSGHSALRLTSYSPNAPHVFSTLSQRVGGLQPNTVYKISYYAKAVDLQPGAVTFAVDAGWNKRVGIAAGTYDWRYGEASINIGHNDYIDLRLLQTGTGSLWLDEIRVESAAVADLAQRAEGLYDAGDYAGALALYRELEARSDPPSPAAGWQAARAYLALGQYPPALERLQRALAAGLRRAEMDLAELYYRLGDYPQAETHFSAALEAVRGDQNSESLALNKLSRCALAQGQLDRALEFQRRAYRILKHIENQHGQALALNQLGDIHARRGEHREAAAQFDAALELAQRLDDKELEAEVLLNRAYSAHAAGQAAAAQAGLDDALPLLARLREPLNQVRGLRLQALLLRPTQPAAAVLFGKQAVNGLQTLRGELAAVDPALQQSLVRAKAETYQELADLLIGLGRLAEAQQVLAMLKEEEYFDFVRRDAGADARGTQAAYTAPEQQWLQRYQGIQAQVAGLGRELGELREAAGVGALSPAQRQRQSELRAQLADANRAFSEYLRQLKTAFAQQDAARAAELGARNLDSLRALKGSLRELGEGTVLLHYLIMPERLHILLTTPDAQLARVVTVNRADLNREIFQLRQQLGDRRHYKHLTPARNLYRLLLEPVAEDLRQAGAKTLLLALDGALRYLPFAALHDGQRYLAETYPSVVYTEAARHNLSRQPAPQWRLAGLGLSRAVPGFNPLPAVERELEGIVRRGPDDPDGVLDGVVRLNAEFTAESLLDALDQAYPVIHLASHFVFQPGTEENSYLLLGDGGRLDLAQIRAGYEFHGVDLLTLSACETALGDGDSANGREVEGFGALAQNNGARGVLASLWAVDDQSTGDLMQRLYALRSEQHLDKAEALRRAQLEFIQGANNYPQYYQHPYYWAAFILMGNWL